MEIVAGNLYFISDAFFDKINDEYLKKNYETSKRPHYFAFRDEATDLYWLVPCSSKVEKFEKLIQKKKEQNKPTDAIQIVKIESQKTVLLFQDMFPARAEYIEKPYFRQGHFVRITDKKQIARLEKTARRIRRMLLRGVRFTPTQPDVIRIEKIMLAEKE